MNQHSITLPAAAVHVAAQTTFLSPLANLLSDAVLAVAGGLRSVAQEYQDRRRRGNTLRQLAALDDRLLEDIGLPRELIKDAAHGHVVPAANGMLYAFGGVQIARIPWSGAPRPKTGLAA